MCLGQFGYYESNMENQTAKPDMINYCDSIDIIIILHMFP